MSIVLSIEEATPMAVEMVVLKDAGTIPFCSYIVSVVGESSVDVVGLMVDEPVTTA